MKMRKRARLRRSREEDDSCSIASSTSMWVMERELIQERIAPVVTLTEDQYDILINIVKQPRLLGCGLYWMPKKALLPWDRLTQLNGHCFVVPLCYMWLGHLRLAMLREGVYDSQSLSSYFSILDAVATYSSQIMWNKRFCRNLSISLSFSDPASYIFHLEHPLRFIVFRHHSREEFEVSVQTTIRNVSAVGRKSKHHPYGKVSKYHANKLKAAKFKEHLNILHSISHSAISLSNFQTSDSPCSLVHFNDSQSQVYLKALDAALDEDSEETREINEFSFQLERSVASISKELENSGTEIDDNRLKYLIFMRDSNGICQLNPMLAIDIKNSLKMFIQSEGEQLLNEQC